VCGIGLMEESTMESGETGSNMEWVYTLLLLERLKRENGTRVKEYSGLIEKGAYQILKLAHI
jgi:hypothetical protein